MMFESDKSTIWSFRDIHFIPYLAPSKTGSRNNFPLERTVNHLAEVSYVTVWKSGPRMPVWGQNKRIQLIKKWNSSPIPGKTERNKKEEKVGRNGINEENWGNDAAKSEIGACAVVIFIVCVVWGENVGHSRDSCSWCDLSNIVWGKWDRDFPLLIPRMCIGCRWKRFFRLGPPPAMIWHWR